MLLLQVLIQLPAIQGKLKNGIVTAIEAQLEADASIGNFRLRFPKELVVNDFLISKNPADTLFYLEEFAINIRILPLMKSQLIAEKIKLKNGQGNFTRLLEQLSTDPDSSGKSKGVEKDNSPPWEFSVENLLVESCYFIYRDEQDLGFELILDMGSVHIKLGKLNLESLIACKSADISNTLFSYESLGGSEQAEMDTITAGLPDIVVGDARLVNAVFTYIDSSGAILFNAGGEKIDVSDLLIDINNEKIALSDGLIKNTQCRVEFLPDNDTTPAGNESLNWGPSLWRVEGDELELEDFQFTLEYQGTPDPGGHFNSNHMDIQEVTGLLSDIVLDADTLVVGITNLSAREKNGLEVVKMEGLMGKYDPFFIIQDLVIETPTAQYSIDLSTSISPTNYIDLEGKEIDITIEVKNGSMREIDYFYPLFESIDFLSEEFRNGNYDLKARIMGSLDALSIVNLEARIFDSTYLITSGNIEGLMHPDSMLMSLEIEEFMASKTDLAQNFVGLIPDSSTHLPRYVKLEGNYRGTNDTHQYTGNIESDMGKVRVRKVQAALGTSPYYQAEIDADLHNIGAIADMGVEQLAFHLEGYLKGETMYSSDGFLELRLDSLTYKEFLYTDIGIKGQLDNGEFEGAVESQSPEVQFKLMAHGMLREEEQLIQIDLDAENIDLYGLKLYPEKLSLRGTAGLDFGVHANSGYHFNLDLQKLDLNLSDSIFQINPVELAFKTNNDSTDFYLNSYYFKLNFKGDDYIMDIADSFADLPFYYLADPEKDSVFFKLPEFQLAGSLDYPEVFASLFFPDVPEFNELKFSGGYSSGSDELDFDFSVPELHFGTTTMDSLYLTLAGTSDALNYACAAKVNMDDLLIGEIYSRGKFENSELIANLRYSDSFSNDYLNLTAKVDTVGDNIVVQFVPGELIFSYDKWDILPQNHLVINPDFIKFKDFELTNEGAKISISSFPEDNPQNIEFKLDDFGLGSLEQLFAMDTVAAGIANAEFVLTNLMGDFSVEGMLTIDDLLLFDFEAGQLAVSNFSMHGDSALVDLDLVGRYQDFSIQGIWNGADSLNPIQASLKINNLNLSELEYMLADYINEPTGKLEGGLKVSGKVSDPLFNGNLNFSDAGMGINFLNNYFSLGSENIVVENNLLEFTDFSIKNKRNQAARINGSINLGNVSKTYTNLSVSTDNMEIMNSTQKQNDILFGILKAQSNIQLKGEVSDIQVIAAVNVDKSTNLTYIFPEHLALDDNEGVVHFAKFEPEGRDDEDISNNSDFFSMQSFTRVKSKIEIEPGAQFQLFFDKGGENYLDASLNGVVNYSLVKDNSEISGMFEVEKGTLRYGIPLVTVEEYTIEEGSYITLSNDVYNPYMNIMASAKVRASTEGLMTGDIKVMIFKVLLFMQGELNDLQLRFDISPETNDALVSSRLKQLSEQERNMNALNLLVRGSFMISMQGDEVGGTSTAEAQIDKFYAAHLNHLISENISFVDLKFDVQSFMEYNEQGETVMQRNYYYNVGKSLFKDRARINYMGSLDLTSDMAAENVNSSFVQSELEVEVKITKDGMLRGFFFRKNEYEGLLEGEVIETGGGLRLQKEFYSVGDIFINEKRRDKKNSDSND